MVANITLTAPLSKVTVTVSLPPQSRPPQSKPAAAFSKDGTALRWPPGGGSLSIKPGARIVLQVSTYSPRILQWITRLPSLALKLIWVLPSLQALFASAQGAPLGPIVTQCQCSSLLSDAALSFSNTGSGDFHLIDGAVAHRRFRVTHKLTL